MMALSAWTITGVSHSLVLVVLIAVALGALEGEHGRVGGAGGGLGLAIAVYLLDGLVIVSTVLKPGALSGCLRSYDIDCAVK